MTVEVIEPHGLCAGVNVAIAKALKLKNVWCLHELVHNEIVVEDLKALGYRFVERVEDVPEGETVVFSAHGVSPAVRAAAKARRLKVVDTTCPFVAKVHRAARAFAEKGLPVVVLGDARHAEVEGIVGEVEALGERAGRPFVVGMSGGALNGRDARSPVNDGRFPVKVPAGSRIGVVSQTTMNADEVERAVAGLKTRYDVETTAEVCRATKERQDAVRAFCRRQAKPASLMSPVSRPSRLSSSVSRPSAAVLVLGSRASSNSRRLAEVAEAEGVRAYLAGTMDEVRALKAELDGYETVGLTSGASTPERFYDEALKFLRNVPRHVAIIMDGNGRWAAARGKRRGAGHVAGAKTLSNVLKWCGERGIKYLTVYAFSTENWKRPKEEVDGLMDLFVKMLKSKTLDFVKNRVRFRMIGRRGDLSARLRGEIERLEAKTKGFEREFIVAISYGGRAEIVDAANAAIAKGEPLTEETFRSFLYAPDVPDPDLVIRTSGERRTSNFLLWETAYSEYHFTETLWPDFAEADLDRALADYAGRHRRQGGV